MTETIHKTAGELKPEILKSEWERLQKLEASYKITQKYVKLLEDSNGQLDGKILEQALLNEMAKGFASAAYDQWNIAGFIFSILKKKLDLSVYALLFMREEEPLLILASEQPLSSEQKATIRIQMAERFARDTKQAVSPTSVKIVEQNVPTKPSHEAIGETSNLHTYPLVIYKEVFGVMGLGLAKGMTLTPDEEHFFGILASQLALFIENDRIRQAITNEKNKLEALSKELTRSNKELEQFAYVASHDLQEPLRMVASYTQLLAKRYQGKLDKDADEFIAFAVDGATRMQYLINDLLDYSRVGRKGKEFVQADCEEVFKKALTNLKIAIEEKKAQVTHDPLPTVMGDDVQLVRLFQNLIGNALKFTKAAELPQIHVSVERKNGELIFSFRDSGIGIDPKHFDRLFQIFQRLHTREEYPGTGIGLAVCKKIVERHGGRVWVESELGKGTTFYFTVPVIEGTNLERGQKIRK